MEEKIMKKKNPNDLVMEAFGRVLEAGIKEHDGEEVLQELLINPFSSDFEQRKFSEFEKLSNTEKILLNSK